MRKLASIIVIISAVAIAFYAFVIRSDSTFAAWYDGAWGYRKSVTLSRATGAVTNYQMKILVGESSGSGTNDVNCDDHCKTDFSDLRFTNSSGTTLLDYWIQSTSGTTPNQVATVWVEFDSIGTGATTFYVYYGNASAAAVSNIVNTFVFADDFDDGSLDTATRWNSAGGGSASETGGTLIVTGAHRYVTSQSTYANNYALHARIMVEASASSFRGVGFIGTAGSYSEKLMTWGFRSYHGDTYFTGESGDGTSLSKPSLGVARDTSYHIMELRRYAITGTNYDRFILDSISPITGSYPTAAARYIDIDIDDPGKTMTLDWIFLRQYLSTEPAWGSWQGEEPAPTPTPTPTITPTPIPWQGSGWAYRKNFAISRASGAVTNYQMKMTVYRSTGTDSGSSIYLGSNVKSDYSDLRFTTSNGTTLLDYWIESFDANSATVWVEFDSIGTTATTFYIYYGNASATAVSNGANTFLYFDDFLGTTLDPSKTAANNASHVSVSGSIVTIYDPDLSQAFIYPVSNSFTANTRYRTRSKNMEETSSFIWWVDGNNSMQWGQSYSGNANYYGTFQEGGLTDWQGFTMAKDPSNYHVWEVIRNSTVSVICNIDDANLATEWDRVLDGSLGFLQIANGAASLYVDWTFVSQYLSPEPAWGSWGNGEAASTNFEGGINLQGVNIN